MSIKLILTCFFLQSLLAEDVARRFPGRKQPGPGLQDSSEVWRRFRGQQRGDCLTGYMTDVQQWVDKQGNINPGIDSRFSVDVSTRKDTVKWISERIANTSNSKTLQVVYLGMSRCHLQRVPTIFDLQDRQGKTLSSTVTYITLYGNDFSSVSVVGQAFDEGMNATDAVAFQDVAIRWPGPSPASWTQGFIDVHFERLKELDLRRCNIENLSDNTFKNMPKLEALYLGENRIAAISSQAFQGLNNLLHLDLSRNFDGIVAKELTFQNDNVLSRMGNLQSLDLSFSLLVPRDIYVLKELRNLTRLSICNTGLNQIPADTFSKTPLRYLDVSGNNGILNFQNPLHGLKRTLQVLYAKQIGLREFAIVKNFQSLEVLSLEGNEISVIGDRDTATLKNLRILNLNNNRIIAWFENRFKLTKKLQFLSLIENNINLISHEMIEDIQNITYVGLSENFIICNCYAREFLEIALQNENCTHLEITLPNTNERYSYHTGSKDINLVLASRKRLKREEEAYNEELLSEGKFVLFDYQDHLYQCLDVPESASIPFLKVNTCKMQRESEIFEVINEGQRKLLALIAIPIVLFPILIFCYVFRRNFKYFFITVRNSATLSLINNNQVIDDGTIFHYDVFVSYCNNDRDWVLDELLPNVEKGCNISVCLHERDFQVGLSILENIVSCMDRSRSILLIISRQFLLSQWCQFEMHLAQHRLLETRREDLILVLLEDVPREIRPTTLHYLMLTKTYIVWPKKDKEKPTFWKRLSRSILSRRPIWQSSDSLA